MLTEHVVLHQHPRLVCYTSRWCYWQRYDEENPNVWILEVIQTFIKSKPYWVMPHFLVLSYQIRFGFCFTYFDFLNRKNLPMSHLNFSIS